MGGSQCRMSIIRNDNVACFGRLFSSMSHIEFKERICPMSLNIYPLCRMSLSPKKCPCRPVDFRVKGHTRSYKLLVGTCRLQYRQRVISYQKEHIGCNTGKELLSRA